MCCVLFSGGRGPEVRAHAVRATVGLLRTSATLRERRTGFCDVKDVLAKANEEKSGDRLAGVAAASVLERVAAKRPRRADVLADLYEHPVVPPEEDAVTRLILDDLGGGRSTNRQSWTVSQSGEYVLDDRNDGAEFCDSDAVFMSEMIAACAKLMTNLDLIVAAKKIRVVVHATNTVGLPGRAAGATAAKSPVRFDRRHPGFLCDGLSFGNGDAVIGVNP